MSPSQRIRVKLVQRIREEFEEIPGLRFTVDEAARFWALERAGCEEALAELTAAGFLARGADGRFGPIEASPVD